MVTLSGFYFDSKVFSNYNIWELLSRYQSDVTLANPNFFGYLAHSVINNLL